MPKKTFDAAKMAKALLATITEAGLAPDDASKLESALTEAYLAGRDDLSTRDMLDVRSVGEVEFLSDHAGKVWLNVDGRCVFRAGKADHLKFDVTREYGERPTTEENDAIEG